MHFTPITQAHITKDDITVLPIEYALKDLDRVLNNKVLVPAETYEWIIEKLDDIGLSAIVELRRSEKANAIEVSLDDL